MSTGTRGFRAFPTPQPDAPRAVQYIPGDAGRSHPKFSVVACSALRLVRAVAALRGTRRVSIALAFYFCLTAGILTSAAIAAGQGPVSPELPPIAFDKMLPQLRAAVQKAYDEVTAHPQNPEANGMLGMILHANNLPAEAEICYRRARGMDPHSFRWTYYLALVQVDQRKCGDAIDMFHEALDIDPSYFPAQLRMGECLLVSSEWDAAGKLYEAVIQKHPNSAEAHYGLGRVRAAHQDLPGAIESFQKACELYPKFAAAHFALARAYRRAGKTEPAEREFELSKNSGGGVPDIEDRLLSEVAGLYLDYRSYLSVGAQFAEAGKFRESAEAFETALEINPQLPQAHARLIYLYGQLGQVAKAEEHYRNAVALDPKNLETYFNYGALQMGQGKTAEAEEAFRKVLELNPRYAEAHNNLGYLLEGQAKLVEAAAEFRKALEIDPDFPQAHFSLGRILVKQGDFEAGLTHLLSALSTNDEEAKSSYLYAAGIAYADAGDLPDGLRYLELAKENASARNQSKLLANIEDDLRLLRGGRKPQ